MTSVLLRSAGFSHGFSTRDVGLDELALLLRLKDAPRFATQAHGTRTVVVENHATNLGEADALVATKPNIAVGVRTADCVPILLADSKSGAVAAVHAGWRGLVDGVIESALGTKDFDLAAIGPCIGACCFEIGEEVAAKLAPYVVKKMARFTGISAQPSARALSRETCRMQASTTSSPFRAAARNAKRRSFIRIAATARTRAASSP